MRIAHAKSAKGSKLDVFGVGVVFDSVARGLAGVVDIRGRGLMLGIELDRPSAPLVRQGLDQGIVFNVTADSVVRLLPPLIFDRHDVDYLLDRLLPLIRQHLQTAH
ncbi:MAG: aminotransferase class III-fold pyridoxal phosphate-dependent enzyme [Betaproteobacteria bacterium]|nr:aminotransferase class III-fold pyridoxal phosphate-dependent enzyme [Betaproteobacteria bacterium]